jgi:hypothetical protein
MRGKVKGSTRKGEGINCMDMETYGKEVNKINSMRNIVSGRMMGGRTRKDVGYDF